ncbi:MAG: YihY/virulence factor BrkB family protein [Thermoleophilaceae bacterium]|nr:YihY/virulence factor BrkB family protein [Thermoleophilaceae bacterium]
MPTTRESADVRAPRSPTDLEGRNWMGVLKRTIKEFKADNLTDWAAALTYYSVLALFPALLCLVALLGVLGQYPQTVDSIMTIVGKVAPQSTVDSIRGPVQDVVRSKGGAGALLGLGLLGSLWSASGYLGAFIRASNQIYETGEGRPFWKLRPLQIAMTVVMIVLLAAVVIGIVVTGDLARAIGDQIGLGSTAVTVWSIAKWPVLLGVVMLMFALLYYAAPNVKQPRFRWISPGGILAVLVWIVASAGFALYVSRFGSYNKTYGTLGGVIVFLIWLWISNIAVLLGAEFDAELERERELEAGLPAHESIQLQPRDEPG